MPWYILRPMQSGTSEAEQSLQTLQTGLRGPRQNTPMPTRFPSQKSYRHPTLYKEAVTRPTMIRLACLIVHPRYVKVGYTSDNTLDSQDFVSI
jgi:hypothetical protein